MNKYIFSETIEDSVPEIRTIIGNSYHDAIERLINEYIEFYDDDEKLSTIDNLPDLQSYLYEAYDVNISDLVDIEEL